MHLIWTHRLIMPCLPTYLVIMWLKVWRTYVHIPIEKCIKLRVKSFHAVLLGHDEQSRTYHWWDPHNNHIVVFTYVVVLNPSPIIFDQINHLCIFFPPIFMMILINLKPIILSNNSVTWSHIIPLGYYHVLFTTPQYIPLNSSLNLIFELYLSSCC